MAKKDIRGGVDFTVPYRKGGILPLVERRAPVTKFTYDNNFNMKTKYSKPPKHALGAIIGAAGTAMSIYNSIKANKQAKEAAQLATNQRNSMLQTEDQFLLDKYPVNGNQMTGFYGKKGGFIPTELKHGSKEEMEHTSSKKVAKRIAKDHLKEDPKYYAKLKKAGLAEEYPNGGNMKLVGYNAKGGNLLPVSSNMDKVKGNTHEENRIDNTNGVKLINATGKAVAEVEDQEVIKDDKKVYSDRLELKKGVTYAKEAERVAKKIADAEKVLSDPTINFRKKNAAKIQRDNWNRAGEDLFNHQEMMKKKMGIKDDDTTKKAPGGFLPGSDKLAPMIGTKPTSSFNFSSVMPYVDNVANAVLTATTPKPAFPMLARQRKLKTDFNINPQLQDVTDTVNQTVSGIERGTSSSNVARQNTTAVKLAGMKAKGQLYSQKENIETGLQNQNTLNQQQIEGQNLARIEGFNDSMQQRAYNIQGRTAANVANAVEDFNKGEQATAFGKYQDEQIRTIRETYNTGGTGLRVDLNSEAQIQYLRANPTFKDNAAKDYLQKNTDGTYKYPREAERFLQIFTEYKTQG